MYNEYLILVSYVCGNKICSLIACVASVSSQGSSRKLGQEQKKKMNDGEGEGEPFFCFRSDFPTITRLETLATQASSLSPRLQHA